MVVIDANNEVNALREATALRIPTIGLIDSDGDPQLVDIPIPGNDDSLRSIEVVISELMSAVSDGLAGRRAKEAAAQRKAEDKAKSEAQEAAAHEEAKSRSSRASFKADDSKAAPKDDQGGAATATAEAPKTETDK
jgi:small subunit ribosomal protein S2